MPVRSPRPTFFDTESQLEEQRFFSNGTDVQGEARGARNNQIISDVELHPL
jgi:hypothetical protein